MILDVMHSSNLMNIVIKEISEKNLCGKISRIHKFLITHDII